MDPNRPGQPHQPDQPDRPDHPDRAYPLRLEGHLQPDLSRWLWLVKWILAIPHFIVLWILWFVLLVLTVVAGIVVLFTGRYPAPIFGFTEGVLRWSWRVAFYALVLGCDKYPPFKFESDPNYPADLSIDYPRRLSRGLVLVKWWLLAIPHYLVLAVFSGRTVTIGSHGHGWGSWPGGGAEYGYGRVGPGLIGLLVLFAAISLLFRRVYPGGIFDFMMGMERWGYRVSAYVLLLRDEYPPFRLDQGGDDPGGPAEATDRPARTDEPPPARPA
jgi:hypothetical protein